MSAVYSFGVSVLQLLMICSNVLLPSSHNFLFFCNCCVFHIIYDRIFWQLLGLYGIQKTLWFRENIPLSQLGHQCAFIFVILLQYVDMSTSSFRCQLLFKKVSVYSACTCRLLEVEWCELLIATYDDFVQIDVHCFLRDIPSSDWFGFCVVGVVLLRPVRRCFQVSKTFPCTP